MVSLLKMQWVHPESSVTKEHGFLKAESSVFPGFQNISQLTLPEQPPQIAAARRAQGVIKGEGASFTFPAQTSAHAGLAGPGPAFLKWFLTRIPKCGREFPCCLCGTPKPQVESTRAGECPQHHKAQLSCWEVFRAGRGSERWNSSLALGSTLLSHNHFQQWRLRAGPVPQGDISLRGPWWFFPTGIMQQIESSNPRVLELRNGLIWKGP